MENPSEFNMKATEARKLTNYKLERLNVQPQIDLILDEVRLAAAKGLSSIPMGYETLNVNDRLFLDAIVLKLRSLGYFCDQLKGDFYIVKW